MRSEHITLDAAFAALNAAAPAYDRYGNRGVRMHCHADICTVSVDVPPTWDGLPGTTSIADGRIVIVEYRNRGVTPVEAVNGCLAALDAVTRAAAEVSA
ncbi:hypothetical protein [Nocardia abscessus]|uniref:hypothetical protein n=1 Tax=Nocardia abscessus TaxID=120957 RepID=UPI0024558156|nr:hypothetical protein [Nocardia abscessus]